MPTRDRILLCALLATSLTGCMVSRVGRPEVTGTVFDAATKQPLAACSVAEVLTDRDGRYRLPEQRYRELAMPGREAPPVRLYVPVHKAGYEDLVIERFDPRGGGALGAVWEMDPVYLERARPVASPSKTAP